MALLTKHENMDMDTNDLFLKIPHTKREIAELAAQLSGIMLNGEEPALLYYLKLRAAQEIIKQVEKEISDASVLEAEDSPGQSVHMMGARISVAEKGVRYDFSICKDRQWEKLDSEIKRLQELRKIREKELKARLHNNSGLDRKGRQAEQPPLKTSKTGLRVDLPKGEQ
jgi:hypothetical protein